MNIHTNKVNKIVDLVSEDRRKELYRMEDQIGKQYDAEKRIKRLELHEFHDLTMQLSDLCISLYYDAKETEAFYLSEYRKDLIFYFKMKCNSLAQRNERNENVSEEDHMKLFQQIEDFLFHEKNFDPSNELFYFRGFVMDYSSLFYYENKKIGQKMSVKYAELFHRYNIPFSKHDDLERWMDTYVT